MTDGTSVMFPAPSDDELEAISILQQDAGGTLAKVGDRVIPLTFPTDDRALAAAHAGVALHDRSHWGCLEFCGEERLEFLHGQTTNDVKSLQPGQGCDTCVVTSTARTIDLTTALAGAETVLLLVSPQRRQTVQNWFARLIRFSRAEMLDISETIAVFELLGPHSERLIAELGAASLVGQPDASHQTIELPNSDVTARLVVGSGLAVPGYLVICDREDAAFVWQRLADMQAVPMGEAAWERLRIRQGRPLPERELTEDFNPLEAGLWHAVSLDKGCYIGQETLARLQTYDGVKQQLWGVQLSDRVELGTLLSVEGNRAGLVTSMDADTLFALAYVRRQYASAGRVVQVGESATGELINLPDRRRSPD